MSEERGPEGGSGEVASLALALTHTLRRRLALGARRMEDPGPPPAWGAEARSRPERPERTAAAPARATAVDPKRPAYQAQPGREEATRPAAGRPESPLTATPTGFTPEGPTPAEAASAAGDLGALEASVATCKACALCESRQRTVFMDGIGTSGIMFVGEAPGADEDRQGIPFVGRAGQLLTDIITKGMGLARADVTIANVLKCRPPGNRDPLPGEKELCTSFLDRQIELVDPKVIVPLGRHAAGHLLGVDAPLGRLRARVHDKDGRKIVPTYHPAYLLRSPHDKKKAWEDIQLAMAEAGVTIPRREQR